MNRAIYDGGIFHEMPLLAFDLGLLSADEHRHVELVIALLAKSR